MTNPVKDVFQKHGLTEPCHICKDNHVPQASWREQENRCQAIPKKPCVCCGECRVKCDGSVHAKEVLGVT